jgi:hypothetical protein
MLKKINEMDLLIESIDTLYGKLSKTINESVRDYDYGKVEFDGKTYKLLDNAEITNRLLPGNYTNFNDVEDGENYDFEMSASAEDENGNECTVYWIFNDVKGESGETDLSNFDYTDVDRVVCEGLDESEDEYVDLDESDEIESKNYSGNDFLVFDNGGETMDRYTIILKDDEDNVDSRGMIPVLISGKDPRGISGHEEIRLNDLLNKLYVPEDASEEDIKDAEEFLGKEIYFSTLPDAVQKFVLNDYNSRDLDESSKLNEATSKIWTGSDVISSKEIIERLDELESDEDLLSDADKEELEDLREFKNVFGEFSEWEDGLTIIARSYFVEYVKDMLEDTGDIPSYIVIDWDATADNIKQDYISYDINGTEFLALARD